MYAIDATANRLYTALRLMPGAEMSLTKSRQSKSTYIYVTVDDADDSRTVSIRISDHMNPAAKSWRVSSGSDRAELTDYEFRTDHGCGYKIATRGDIEIADWQSIAIAVYAEFGAPVPASLAKSARDAANRRAAAQAKRDAEDKARRDREAAEIAERNARHEAYEAAVRALDPAAYDAAKAITNGPKRREKLRMLRRRYDVLAVAASELTNEATA